MSAWRSALPVTAALIGLLLVLYRETALGMVGIWTRSETFAHGFLVVPISAWLIWRLRHRLASLQPAPQPWFLLPLAAVAAIWFAADLVVVNAASQFALVGLIILAVPITLGTQVARTILFPLLFLLFGVPFGEFMLPPMMQWTADFVIVALQLTGIPVYREGLQFVIPSGSWSVIDECSGVRYVIASFMVGSLFAYLNYESYKRRAAFMVFALLVPVVANWLRAYMIVMLGHLSGNKLAVGVDHILYGWVFFGIVIFVMFAIGSRWAEPEVDERLKPVSDAAPAAFGAVEFRQAAVAVAIAAVVLALPHVVSWNMQRVERQASRPMLTLPEAIGPWLRTEVSTGSWKLPYEGATVTATSGYAGTQGVVGVHVAYYRGQTNERKLVSSTNALVALNDRLYKESEAGSKSVEVPGGTLTLRTAQINGPAQQGKERRAQLVVWHAYWINGRIVTSDVQAKLLTAWARVTGGGDDGAAIVVFADEPTPAGSRQALEAFMRVGYQPLDAALRRTHANR